MNNSVEKDVSDVLGMLGILADMMRTEVKANVLAYMAEKLSEALGANNACKAIEVWSMKGRTFPAIADLIEASQPKKGSIVAAIEESLNQMQARIAAGTEKLPVTRLAAHAWNELGGWDVIGQMPIDPGRHPQAYDSFIKRMRSTLWGVVERFKNGSIEDDKLIIYMKPYDGSMPPSNALLDASNELN